MVATCMNARVMIKGVNHGYSDPMSKELLLYLKSSFLSLWKASDCLYKYVMCSVCKENKILTAYLCVKLCQTVFL